MASLLVEELGENPSTEARSWCSQSPPLTTHAAFAAQNEDEVDIEDVRKLARAAKDVLQARKASMEERRQIEQEAREKLLQEQEQRLEEQRGSDGTRRNGKPGSAASSQAWRNARNHSPSWARGLTRDQCPA
ncbi:DUF3486 family protein [Pseudomonas aeruginosa]|uniref:DUF3486 family protein n=1 Tax=Pseudomonas aeruginosa TaxID=287 RepID=UPI0023B0E779|nr:DUF3486 family protein [Pseudomonas aeruginosa]MDE8660746.1 DUF3486 family protein [Pseudomonas aeruginosa]